MLILLTECRGDDESAETPIDDDVLRENATVESYFNSRKIDFRGKFVSDTGSDDWCEFPVLVDGLIKIYNPMSNFLAADSRKVAVRGVSVAIRKGDPTVHITSYMTTLTLPRPPIGEVFGLLGQNGAGKSTTFGVLTGDTAPTAGGVYVGGHSVLDPLARRGVGYCAQTDPLFELLNAYETLYFYGGIRGIPEPVLRRRARRLIDDVGLAKHAHRPCGTYSGGNKRKLSLAIALIGAPKVLFLDEPSSGMVRLRTREQTFLSPQLHHIIATTTTHFRPTLVAGSLRREKDVARDQQSHVAYKARGGPDSRAHNPLYGRV